MEEVNIYLHGLNRESLSIARKVRGWKSRKVRLVISASDLKSADKNVQNIVGNWRENRAEVMEPGKQIDWALGYYEWNLTASKVECITSEGIKAIIQRCRAQKCQFVIVGDAPKCKNQMASFVDAPKNPVLPDRWHKFPWFTTFGEIEKFCRQNGVVVFDPVNNRARFRPTKKQGMQVYEDLETGYFIYLDQLHKTHYEAFDHTGRHHLGEISLDGILDPHKADPNKHLTL